MEDDNLIWIKNVRDANIVFSTKDGETCYNYDVKVLYRFDKLYHNEPKNDFIEMISYSLGTHGV